MPNKPNRPAGEIPHRSTYSFIPAFQSDAGVQTKPIRSSPAGPRGPIVVKQTQFPADEHPISSITPAFQYSNPMPIVRNKPNSANRLAEGRAPVVQTNPIGGSSSEEGRSCEETKPIWGPGGRRPRAGCTNKANSVKPGWYPGTDCAKRTQFPPDEIPPSIPVFQSDADRAKQSQFPPSRPPRPDGPAVRNEANSREPPYAVNDCNKGGYGEFSLERSWEKQSQFSRRQARADAPDRPPGVTSLGRWVGLQARQKPNAAFGGVG